MEYVLERREGAGGWVGRVAVTPAPHPHSSINVCGNSFHAASCLALIKTLECRVPHMMHK